MKLLRNKIKLGCLDYTFNYLPFPVDTSFLANGFFSALNKFKLVKKYHYIKRAIEKISELGFQGIQIMCQDIKQMPFSARKLENLCSNAGLEISSLGGYIDFLSVKWDPKRFMSIVDYALGCNVNILCTYSGIPKDKQNDWATFTEHLNGMIDYAKAHDIRIAVENIPKSLIRTCDDFMKLMKTVGGIYINFDPTNLNLVGGNVIDSVMKLKRRIIQTHSKDFIRTGGWKFVPVGRGDVPYPEYLESLKKIGFRGFLIVEYEGFGNPLKAVEKSKEYLESELMKIEK